MTSVFKNKLRKFSTSCFFKALIPASNHLVKNLQSQVVKILENVDFIGQKAVCKEEREISLNPLRIN
jgi:hypothetical protein